jgi:hypothetical protein
LGSDEGLRLKKYLGLNGVTAITFWGALNLAGLSQGIIAQTILKFVLYVSVILWLNTLLFFYTYAKGLDVDSWEFQKEQVKLSLWTLGIFILREIPLWLSVIGAP